MNGDQSLTGAETATLLTLIDARLARMEDRIIARLDLNAAGAAERWRLHDEQSDLAVETITAKFVALGERLDAHMVVANAHFARQHDDDIAMDARVRPVRIGVAWAASHWKDIAILAVAVLGLFAVTADILSRYLGGPP